MAGSGGERSGSHRLPAGRPALRSRIRPRGARSAIRRAPRLWAAVFSAIATAAAIAIVVAIAPGSHSPAQRPAQRSGHRHLRPVRDRPLTGRYWHVQTLQVLMIAGGTQTHPYDIAIPEKSELWLSPRAGLRDWALWQQLGAVPATPADRVQWRAAGSPQRWTYGTTVQTTSPSAATAAWAVGHGKVGYIEGDLPFWTLRQFKALPANPGPLMHVLRQIALTLPSARDPGSGGATADQLIWDEAIQILQSPVRSQVRLTAALVLAELPGVRALGLMRDPLGRGGYGIGTGPSALGQIAVIDPRTGWLLAIEDPGTPAGVTPGTLRRPTDLRCTKPGHCIYSLPYYQRVYRGQLAFYTAVVTLGWTSSGPPLATPISPNSVLIGY